MKTTKNLTASAENYLKAIHNIVKINKAARVKDIANYLSIGASSVSEALKQLAEKGYINYQPYGIVTLTDVGEEIANGLNHRHEVISNFLENVLLVDKAIVDENSTKLEHGISEEVVTKFVRFIEFMQTCACKEPKWIKSFKHYSANGELASKCQTCISVSKDNPDMVCNGGCCGNK